MVCVESTVGYYQAINKGVKESLGDLHSAKIAMYSVDFSQIENYSIVVIGKVRQKYLLVWLRMFKQKCKYIVDMYKYNA